MAEELARKLLKKANFKVTPGRSALINLLLNAEEPLSQQEISSKLTGTKMNYVSIYRSLEAFVAAGIVHRIEGCDRIWRFALNSEGKDGHSHPHFICTSCGRTECLEGIEVPKIEGIPKEYVINEQEFILKGLCARCS
ncbi:MAG: Fur family transcriptional regulator [Bacillota bacterium]